MSTSRWSAAFVSAAMFAIAVYSPLSDASPKLLWDESVDGDLPQSAPLPTYKLAAPTSQVIGGTCFVASPPLPPQCSGDTADNDAFAFIVPNHAHLVGITFQYTPTFLPGPGSDFGRIVWTLAVGGGGGLIGSDEAIFTTDATATADFFVPYLPVDPGTYELGTGQHGKSNDWVMDYTITLLIERAPEPATLALLGIGLAGLGFSRRKR